MALSRGKGTRWAVQTTTIDGETVDIIASANVAADGTIISGGAVDDALKPLPASSTNGTPLGTKPAGATGFIIYLVGSDSVTGTFATSQPGSAPSDTVTRTATQVIEWPQVLGAGVQFYVTASAGAPKFRWV